MLFLSWIEQFQFFHQLKKLSFIKEIWGYGSRARGDQQIHSDIDLAILCLTATQSDWRKVQDIIDDADTLLKIDCVRFDLLEEESEFKKNIEKDKVILFKREKNMFENKIQGKLKFLDQALKKLEEMIVEPVDKKRAQIDSSIQRFEFSFELFWKTLKVILEEKGQMAAFPKDVLKLAYQGGLIEQQKLWLAMLKDRNETSHVYDEKMADQIYHRIKTQYAKELREVYDKITNLK